MDYTVMKDRAGDERRRVHEMNTRRKGAGCLDNLDAPAHHTAFTL